MMDYADRPYALQEGIDMENHVIATCLMKVMDFKS
jgi:hypothetical protein